MKNNDNSDTGEKAELLSPSINIRSYKTARILKLLPLVFICCLIGFLYIVFTVYHLVPLLRDKERKAFLKGVIETVIFNFIFGLFSLSYTLSVITPPGTIPDDPLWIEGGDNLKDHTVERKKEGNTRHCKWCNKYKPDRAHHCRQCRKCILKMDHHCPWLFNCVGWGNHKYFLLTLIYGTASAAMILATEIETVKSVLQETRIHFGVLALLLFSEALSGLLAVVCGGFLIFHMWICSTNMSTIEFCEKHFRHGGPSTSIYSKGLAKNLGDVFGYNPLLWLIPYDNRPGDGIHFSP